MTVSCGQQFGNYRLIHLLGKGGFADVYLAEHLYLKTQAAVKILYARLSSRTRERFLSEARTLSKLQHQQIIRLLDCGIEHEAPYLVMEYASAGNLYTAHPPGTKVPLATVVSYMTQIASALQYAHDHHIIHRDLKPENVLIGSDKQVLLSDFGLALAINSADYLNVTSLSGTLAYMAPEQLCGRPEFASDQYALAILVYEWLSGQRPFQGTLTEICSQHLLVPPAMLRKTLPELPLAVEQVIFRALEKDPTSRFPNLQAFAHALEQASSRRTSPPQPAPLSLREEQSKIQEQSPAQLPEHFNILPKQSTTFIGREKARQAACALLIRPEVRLLTLVGVGGIGKTSLALSLAAGISKAFTHGICFVPLASLRDPEQVLPAIAWTLGLREQGQGTLAECLKQFLSQKHLLLVLDNLEHLTASAPALADLLDACPQITLLVTSRSVLHISGEQQFLVPVLDLPELSSQSDWGQIAQSEAVRLLVERARLVKPDFQVTPENARMLAEICIHLDGLPLAIELAAARLRLLTPASLLTRLERRLALLTSGTPNLPARQRTLRSTIEWSYDGLSEEEKCLFRRLAVFIDGCELAAIEALYTLLGEDPTPILDGVTSLLDKSMLIQREQDGTDSRLLLLETLREFGGECLAEIGECERCLDAHAAYYQLLVQQLFSSRTIAAFDAPVAMLEKDYANILSVLQRLIVRKEADLALPLAIALTGFWFLRGTLSEGRSLLQRVIDVSRTEQPDKTRKRRLAIALGCAGWLDHWQNENERAREMMEESLLLLDEVGSQVGRGQTLMCLGTLEIERPGGDYRRGQAMIEESLCLLRELRHNLGIANALLLQGMGYMHRGDSVQTRINFKESLDLYRAGDYPWGIAVSLHYLGWTTYLEGDIATALVRSEEAIAIFRRLGSPPFIDEALVVYGFEHLAIGQQEYAGILFEETLTLGQKLENPEFRMKGYYGLGRLALYQGKETRASACFEQAIKLSEHLRYVERTQWIIAASLEGLAVIALAQHDPSWAAHLCAAAAAQRSLLGGHFPLGFEQATYNHTLSEARAALGDEEFSLFWEGGRTLSPVQALDTRSKADTPPVRTRHSQSEALLPFAATSVGLTRRELDVLERLSQGQTNAQIAEDLVLSPVTINSYLRTIYSKLGVTSRTQAMRYAVDHGLL